MFRNRTSQPKIYRRTPFYKFLQNILLKLLKRKLDFTFEGLENLPASGSYIMVANHETIADGLLIACALTDKQLENFHALAGADLAYNYGIWGIMALHIGQAVPIDRQGNPLKGMSTAKELLKQENKTLLVFPEGTRSYDGHLGPIHGGAALLVRNTKLPLIPVFIDGAYEFYNRYYEFPHFKDKDGKKLQVRIQFGAPLDTSNCRRTKEITAILEKWFLTAFDAKKVPRDFDSIPKGPRPENSSNDR